MFHADPSSPPVSLSGPGLDALPPFEPHPLIRGGHCQTVLSVYLWKRCRYQAQQVVIRLDDDDELVLHDDCPATWARGDRVVLLVHGLAGCHGSGYMQRIAAKLVDRNVRVFRMDMRGCGAGAHRARRSLHAGRTADLLAAIHEVSRLTQHSPLACVGFSLGGSIVLKLLGQLKLEALSLIDSAVAVSAPLDLAACSRNLPRGLNQLYDRNFVRRLIRDLSARQRAGVQLSHIDWHKLPRTLYDFDASYTAPMAGFTDVEQYYADSSCIHELADICVPTSLLHAEDDPLIPGRLYAAASFSSTTRVHLTQQGGHLGFLSARGLDPDWYWMDWRVVQLVLAERRVGLTIQG